jgi:hypothetical protein
MNNDQKHNSCKPHILIKTIQYSSAVSVRVTKKERGVSLVIKRVINSELFSLSFVASLWSSDQSSWLQIQMSRVRFPTLPDFLRSRGSGTGSIQPREDN